MLQATALVSLAALVASWASASSWLRAVNAVGSAISRTGVDLGEALMPRWVTRRLIFALVMLPLAFALTWLATTWYIALVAVICAAILAQWLGSATHAKDPFDRRYTGPIVADLERRLRSYEAKGDAMRARVASDLLSRLQQPDRGESTEAQELAQYLANALAAIQAVDRGEVANGAVAFIIALMRARELMEQDDWTEMRAGPKSALGAPSSKDLLLGVAAAAYTRFLETPLSQRAALRLKGFPIDELTSQLGSAIAGSFFRSPGASPTTDDEAIRQVGGPFAQYAFNAAYIRMVFSVYGEGRK